MNRSIRWALALLLGMAVAPTDALARGFGGFGGGGGFHAGGFGGGGFGGGGFGGAGGFHAGGFGGGGFGDAGGFHAGGLDAGGLGGGRAGGFEAGGLGGSRAGGFDAEGARAGEFGGGDRAGGFGGSLNRGELNSFLGLPTDGGMHAASEAYGGRGFTSGAEGDAAWRGGVTGHVYQGPEGTTVAHGTAGIQGAAVGPGGAAAGGKVASGTVVKGPEGNVYAHGETAGRGVAAGPNGVVAGGGAAAGTADRGPEGNVYARGAAAGRGVAAGPNGVVARGGAVAGRGYYSATGWHAQAVAGQRWFASGGYFTPGWVTAHPWAWSPAGYTAAAWATAAWRAATWPTLGTWFGWGDAPIYNYDYGTDIVYQDGNVYYSGQPAGTAAQFYQQATTLANSSSAAGSTDQDGQWLPLGVFGLQASGEKTPSMVFQLAVSKDGRIRGNYYDQVAQNNLPVTGAVDKKDQRVAWHVGDNKDLVVETGLYNLTQNESTALVHFGPDRTAQYQLVRMKQPSQAEPQD